MIMIMIIIIIIIAMVIAHTEVREFLIRKAQQKGVISNRWKESLSH
jgi:hypothetical protein